MNKQNYSLLDNTSCSDMGSRYEVIKSIGSRAKQESFIPASVGGIGNAQVKSNHGIFWVKPPLTNGSEASSRRLHQITVKFHQYPLECIVEEDISSG